MQLAYGAADAWSSAVYGQNSASALTFLQSQFNQVGNYVNDATKKFYQASQKAFEHYNGAEAMRYARKVLSGLNMSSDAQYIIPLQTVKDFQYASDTMQRWVMASPVVRELYHKQRCDGYSDTYQDLQPGKTGEDLYDYRRAVNGLVDFKEDGGYEAVNYFEELRDNDRELDFGEQLAVAHSWRVAEALLKFSKDDITSKSGDSL